MAPPAGSAARFAARPVARLLDEIADALDWPRSRPGRVLAGDRAASGARLVLCPDETALAALDAGVDTIALLATPPTSTDGRAGKRAYDPFVGSADDVASWRRAEQVVLDVSLLVSGGAGGVADRLVEHLDISPVPGHRVAPALRAVELDAVKFVGYIPVDVLDLVRDAVFDAGGGRIGAYDRCSWSTHGTGTFRAGDGATPAVGAVGSFEQVAEVRLEVLVPRHRLAQVARAFVAAHPYEVPAFDVFELALPAPVGFGRIGVLGAGGGAALWTALGQLDPELLAYGAPDQVTAGRTVALHVGPVRDVFSALLDEDDLGLVVASAASDAEIDALTDRGASVLVLDRVRAVGAFADQIAGVLSRALTLPVTVASGLRFPDTGAETSPPTPAEVFDQPDAATGTWRLHFDGGSRGNPGPASYGWVLYDPAGNEAHVSGVRVGRATNNVAEWTGLLAGLERAIELGIKDLDVRGDSELIVKQFNGVYKVKNADLKPIADAAKALGRQFDRIRVSHVYRADNARADQLANEAMDGLRNE